MAPEQARAEKGLSTAVDTYSLGVILYELSTGQPPFRAATPLDTILQVLEREPVPPRQLDPSVDRDLQTICLKCLEKEPMKRFGSAEALAEDLERWSRGEPILAQPTPLVIRAWKWVKRRPAAAALLGMGLLAGLSILVVGLIYNGTLEAANRRLRVAVDQVGEQKRAVEGRELQLRAEQEQSQVRLRKSLFEQGRAERLAGRRWDSLKVLAEAAQLGATPELRQEAIESVTAAGMKRVCQLERQPWNISGDFTLMAFSAEGALLAAAEQGGIKVWRIPSGEVVGRLKCSEFGACFSPAAPLLAVWSKDQVRLWDAETKHEVTFPGKLPFSFNPNGQLLAFAAKGGIGLWDVAAGRQSTLEVDGEPASFITADELIVRDAERISVWNVTTKQQIFATPEGWVPIGHRGLFPAALAGRFAALRQGDSKAGLGAGDVAVWDLALRRRLDTVPDVAAIELAGSLPLAPEGGIIAFPDAKDSHSIQVHYAAAHKSGRRLVAGGFVFGRFNSDGTLLAASEASGGVRVWEVASGVSLGYLPQHFCPVWSPDGRYLAAFTWGSVTHTDGHAETGPGWALNVCEVTPGTAAGALGTAVQALEFSADGEKLATGDAVWMPLRQGSRRSLVPLESSADDGSRYFGSPGRLWALRAGPRARPPFSLAQVFPDNREIILSWAEQRSFPRNLAVSPDGNRLLIEWQVRLPRDGGGEIQAKQLELHDLAKRRREHILVKADEHHHSGGWPVLLFSPDGRLAVHAGDGSDPCTISDVESGKVLRTVPLETQVGAGHSQRHNVVSAAFSPDSRILYTGASEGRFDAIDVESGSILRTWYQPQATARALALSPNGAMLVSAGQDMLIRLWDPASGKELARWLPHPSGAQALAFQPDSQVLATGGDDGIVKLWDLAFIRKELAAIGLDW